MAPVVSELASHTGYWLRMVSNAVSQGFAVKVSKEGVTVAEWVFLRALYGNAAMAPSALAEAMGMSKGGISKLSDRLLKKGLIARADSLQDRRAHTLSLTDEGRAKVPLLAALADVNDAEQFGVLTADEQRALVRILKGLAERHGLKASPVD